MQKAAKETWQKPAARDKHWKIEKGKKKGKLARRAKREEEKNWARSKCRMRIKPQARVARWTTRLPAWSWIKECKSHCSCGTMGGESFECGESTANAHAGKETIPHVLVNETKKNRQGTWKQCFPVVPTRFRHFCTFETNTQARERNENRKT